ncbi:MAG TPA: histone-like nucleoid-structuring protein Lsr2 [Sphingomicrobium sp.]|nr:histone-like nucleoid-structuring protein Lsr2 [Sphingomicrobium sp.]
MESLSDVWDYEDWKADAAYWLKAHAMEERLWEVAQRLGLSEPLPLRVAGILYEDLADYVAETSQPEALLDAWEQAANSEPTDLTDQEWVLLEPFISKRSTASEAPVVRQAINGMLWRQAHPAYLRLPARYGPSHYLNRRRFNYRRTGVFARMLAGLEGKPGPERLVAWLRGIESDRNGPVVAEQGDDAPTANVETKPPVESIRAWAKEHGYRVSDRGRLSREVVAAFQEDQKERRV